MSRAHEQMSAGRCFAPQRVDLRQCQIWLDSLGAWVWNSYSPVSVRLRRMATQGQRGVVAVINLVKIFLKIKFLWEMWH